MSARGKPKSPEHCRNLRKPRTVPRTLEHSLKLKPNKETRAKMRTAALLREAKKRSYAQAHQIPVSRKMKINQ